MKTRSTPSSNSNKKNILYPVLVRDISDNSIMLFLTSTSAVLLENGECHEDVGFYFSETDELSECDKFVILPEGFEVTLIQSQDVSDD